jgi:hypothetical protein
VGAGNSSHRLGFGLAAASGLAALLLGAGVYAIEDESAASFQTTEPGEDHPSFEVRHAAAELKLANFDLQRALLANRETPQTIVEAEIERLRRSVAAAEKRFTRAKAAWKSASSSAAIEAAEQQHNQAESAYRKALTANSVTPNAVNPLELQRLKLAAELARYEVCRQRAEILGAFHIRTQPPIGRPYSEPCHAMVLVPDRSWNCRHQFPR